MKHTWLLVLGALATLGFAWVVLVAIPQTMLVELEAPPGLEAYSRTEARGREVCHSQQVRDDAFTSDVARGWGPRPTAPADYVYDRPHLLGTMRTGPDLINVGLRLPDQDWHLIHLYDPRALVEWSIMPPFPFLFDEVGGQVGGSLEGLDIPGRPDGAPAIFATQDALALVDYLLSLERAYPLPRSEEGEPPGTAAGRTERTMP